MTPSQHTDLYLFNSIVSGDGQAFEALFHRYADEIFSYSLKIVHTRFWAEETVQTVFLQIWASRATLGSVSNPRSYLFKIAANRSIDILRTNEKFFRAQHSISGDADQHAASSLADMHESEQIIHRAIESLPARRKLIYLLKNNGELSYDQIASKLHVSVHTVRNQLAKALETIRAYLGTHDIYITIAIILFHFS